MAKLTADNLVVLMRYKDVEARAESAVVERDQLRLAFAGQQGPWFEEVGSSLFLLQHFKHLVKFLIGNARNVGFFLHR